MYVILLCVECGATIFIFWPVLLENSNANNSACSGNTDLVHAYMNPVWETTNVFLVFAIVSLIALFPAATPVWGAALIVPFFIFLVVAAVRVTGMLYVFYRNGNSRAMKAMLFIAAMLAPAVLLGGTVPFFLTGALPHDASTWELAIAIGLFGAAGVISFSTLFFDYARAKRGANNRDANNNHSTATLKHSSPLRALTIASFSVLLACFALAELFLYRAAPHAFSWTALYAAAALGLITLALLMLVKKSGRVTTAIKFLLGALFFGVVYFGVVFAQLPYVVYPTLTVLNSFTDPQSAIVLLSVFAVGIVITVPALILLYFLFAA